MVVLWRRWYNHKCVFYSQNHRFESWATKTCGERLRQLKRYRNHYKSPQPRLTRPDELGINTPGFVAWHHYSLCTESVQLFLSQLRNHVLPLNLETRLFGGLFLTQISSNDLVQVVEWLDKQITIRWKENLTYARLGVTRIRYLEYTSIFGRYLYSSLIMINLSLWKCRMITLV